MNDTRPAIQFNYIALASRETAATADHDIDGVY